MAIMLLMLLPLRIPTELAVNFHFTSINHALTSQYPTRHCLQPVTLGPIFPSNTGQFINYMIPLQQVPCKSIGPCAMFHYPAFNTKIDTSVTAHSDYTRVFLGRDITQFLRSCMLASCMWY